MARDDDLRRGREFSKRYHTREFNEPDWRDKLSPRDREEIPEPLALVGDLFTDGRIWEDQLAVTLFREGWGKTSSAADKQIIRDMFYELTGTDQHNFLWKDWREWYLS